ncbi:hypothetical protein IEO70_09145 [Bacillus sp. AGMB 02131]|uniref:Uncharacterized protein n=1 Tax=Peribacillus faecalis TaxID=2772559 RepID=A0A927HCK8_9BACI|nr:hypothetical protein [Peribacillus faecalis]MBD3108533.1 hypothetical protein [Peribacillus faecalis]
MNEEKTARLEQLVCDLIKQNARSLVKLNSYDEQIRQMQQRITALEQLVCALEEKDTSRYSLIS